VSASRQILVTGGAGFIGSHLVDALLAAGHAVTVVDNFDPFYPRAIKERNVAAHGRHPRWRLVECDIRDPAELRESVPAGIDAIVHLAAKAGVRPSIEDPLGYQDVNVRGTLHLLELARERRVPQFVLASSSSVYGVSPRVPWSEEECVLQPISPYAGTKVGAELLGHVYSHLHGTRVIALRFFTVYGPRQRPDLAIHRFARLMLDGRPIPVFGDGTTRRDYTYVDDVVSGVCAAIDYDRTPYEVVNLGNNRTITLREMIGGLEEALGVRARIERLPEQPGDVPQTWANIEKAGRLLGYAPTTPYADGVRRFAEWINAQGAEASPVSTPGVQVLRAHMSAMERTAWLFTRGGESVRIELSTMAAGVQLTIDGPGPAASTHEFPPGTSVEPFRVEYEKKLQEQGYKLQIVAERRNDPDRAPESRDRRRR